MDYSGRKPPPPPPHKNSGSSTTPGPAVVWFAVAMLGVPAAAILSVISYVVYGHFVA